MARGVTIGFWGGEAAVMRPPPQLLQGAQGAAVEAEAAEGAPRCSHLSSTHTTCGAFQCRMHCLHTTVKSLISRPRLQLHILALKY
jgi:hypothetical protein